MFLGLQQNKLRVAGRLVEPLGNRAIPVSGAKEKPLGLTPRQLGLDKGMSSYHCREVFLEV